MSIEDRIGKDLRWLPGYQGLYACDDKGQVWYRTIHGKIQILSIQHIKTGQPVVKLIKRGYPKSHLLCRLILKAWVSLPSRKNWVVGYKDGDITNLNLDNLFWHLRKGIPTKKATPVELWQNEKLFQTFRTISDANKVLRFKYTSEMKKYAQSGEEYKGFRIRIPDMEKASLIWKN
jgi:hypothetical protein